MPVYSQSAKARWKTLTCSLAGLKPAAHTFLLHISFLTPLEHLALPQRDHLNRRKTALHL